MNTWNYLGILFIVVGLIGGGYVVSKYAENNGYCILVCQWSKEIAQAREEAKLATDRAEDAEDRAEVAERNTEGISPWIGLVALLLLVMLFFWNEISNDNAGNIELEEAEERCAEYIRKRFGLVPVQENPKEGYITIWSMSGQLVPGSKDSWFYVVCFVKLWPPGMSYPPGYGCTTMWMLSTDPKRAMGVIPGMNALEMHSVFANMKLQKTATPTDIANALDRALTEKRLNDTVREVRDAEVITE